MRRSRDLCEKLRRHVLTRDEHVDRLDAREGRRLDRVLAFDEEIAGSLAPASVVKLADELQALVVAGGDQL
jgi:hypothetical protein